MASFVVIAIVWYFVPGVVYQLMLMWTGMKAIAWIAAIAIIPVEIIVLERLARVISRWRYPR